MSGDNYGSLGLTAAERDTLQDMDDNMRSGLGLTAGELAALQERDDDIRADLDEPVAESRELDYSVAQDLADRTPPPEAITEHLRNLSAQIDALEADYESGDSDLTFAEHRAALRELERQRLDASSELAEARLVHRMAADAAGKQWQRKIEDTRREAKRMGLDLDKNPELAAQWDRAVKFLGGDPENANQSMEWFLREGLKMVAVRHGKLKPERDPFTPRHHDTRPSMGGRDDYRSLDDLSGLELEKALARMSPEQAERWLRSA